MQAFSSFIPSNTDGKKVSHRLPNWSLSVIKATGSLRHKNAENLPKRLPLRKGGRSGKKKKKKKKNVCLKLSNSLFKGFYNDNILEW